MRSLYDIVVKNGLVIDPSQGINEVMDVAVSDGTIADLRRGLNATDAQYVVDASGMIVTPGLIDLHVHCCYGIAHLAVNPDLACLAKGSTTVLDAGSTGELNFMGFKKYVMKSAKTRIYALINIESQGMIEFSRPNQKWPNLITGRDEMFINIEGVVNEIKHNRDVILGIKWAHHGIEGVKLSREAADKAGCFLMAENHLQPETLKYMRKGDIITHLYHGLRMKQHDGLLDADGNVQLEFFEAVRRGVVLDVGHGAASFKWSVAKRGIEQGIKPDTISTDLHRGSYNGPAYDLPTTMSKFLHLGLSLEDVVKATTVRPAEVLGKENTMGTLRPGACGDITILKIEEGRFPLEDAAGEWEVCRRKLRTIKVIKDGEIVF
ncbi:MAG: amidohydrolase/deacetylase family metallohydrolase [candidate division WOR-3 bacterium]